MSDADPLPGSSRAGAQLLIVGGSTRAAAYSALRSGIQPICADLFGDCDLQLHSAVISVDNYPAGLPDSLTGLSPLPWVYTGGLENHAAIVEQISANHRLLGNDAAALGFVRDPFWISRELREAGFPALDVRAQPEFLHATGWLRKPRSGAGGQGIEVWHPELAPVIEECYFQQRIAGEPISAQFLATPDGVEFLGAVRQLVGLTAANTPTRFTWCGGIFPAELARGTIETMTAIGRHLARAGHLRGLFGCDFIVSNDVPWLTEVNPRYTAAMELLEHRVGVSLIGRHIAACNAFNPRGPDSLSHAPASDWCSSIASQGVVGKVVLFAGQDSIAEDARALLIGPRDDRLPFVADLPFPGQRIPAGQPVCTLFAPERHFEACLSRLVRCAKQYHRSFLRPV